MPQLLDYPQQLLTTAEVLALLRLKNKRSLRRWVREKGFPPPSVRAGVRGQLWRAVIVDDWIKRQEQLTQGAKRHVR
jgi:predicted DNA-binding transcriptional regulator AlpA